MWNSAHDAYVESKVLSADPLELVRLLYQTAPSSVADARRFLAAGQIAERSRSINRACEVILELNAALDHTRGGAISERLAALYQYLLNRLLEANFQQSDAALAEVSRLLSTLDEAWQQIRPQRVEVTPTPVASPWPLPEEAVSVSASQAWSA